MKYFIILISILILSSCATKKERAVRHVQKAIRLHSTILNEFYSPIRFDTTIFINKQVVTPEKKIYLSVNEDSLKRALEKQLGVKSLLVENDKLKIELTKTKDGWYEFLATVKPDTLTLRDTVYINKEIPCPPPIKEKVKGYFYNSGILFNILLVLLIIFATWRLLRK